jgi:hypothetical protein
MRTKPPLSFLPSLTQHFFARAVAIFWQCSLFQQSRPSENLRSAME